MIKIVLTAIIMVICSTIVKEYNKSISVFLSIVGCSIVFVYLSKDVSLLIDKVNSVTSSIDGVLNYVKLMLKILGIVIISQLTINICKDNGEGTIASLVEISSKVVVLSLVMPLFETIITIVSGLMK